MYNNAHTYNNAWVFPRELSADPPHSKEADGKKN